MTKYVMLVCVLFMLGCGQQARQRDLEARQRDLEARQREWEKERQQSSDDYYAVNDETKKEQKERIEQNKKMIAYAEATRWIREPPHAPNATRSKATNTHQPLELVGHLPGEPNGTGLGSLAVKGKYAYLVPSVGVEREDDYLEVKSVLRVVDISNPAAPTVVGTCDEPELTQILAVVGDYAYITAADEDGFLVVDISKATVPSVVGSCDKPEYPWKMAVVGDYAYAVARGAVSGGLSVLDVSNPKVPKEVGVCDAFRGGQGIAVAGDYAYIGTEYDGLRVVDISDPKAPKEVGFCKMEETDTNAGRVAVVGKYAYVADFEGARAAMVVVDVSDPKAPKQVSKYSEGMVVDLAVRGKNAYLACGGLAVVDIADPATPREVKFYEETEKFYHSGNIVMAGDYMFVFCGGQAGLFIFRITEDSNESVAAEKPQQD